MASDRVFGPENGIPSSVWWLRQAYTSRFLIGLIKKQEVTIYKVKELCVIFTPQANN